MFKQNLLITGFVIVFSISSSFALNLHRSILHHEHHKHDEQQQQPQQLPPGYQIHIVHIPSLSENGTVIVATARTPVATEKGSSKKNYPETAKLRFKLSGRSLPSMDTFGESDPYVIVTYTENKMKGEKTLGRTATIKNNLNPNWGDIFEITYVKGTKQRLHFAVWDKDHTSDDLIGEAGVNLGDYVRNDEFSQLKLKEGFLIMEKV